MDRVREPAPENAERKSLVGDAELHRMRARMQGDARQLENELTRDLNRDTQRNERAGAGPERLQVADQETQRRLREMEIKTNPVAYERRERLSGRPNVETRRELEQALARDNRRKS
jgi:hypothetical protein